ncbi:MAG TPA: twin-arginine translocase TatA/TatE family subunit [Pyrinomonadaceae bacterium]|nr:twin-arginine translocase TatA/TatE family subunit [Pyrinomonadaceae bacterium]
MPTTLLVFEFIGTTELLVIALVALIVFGPRKLPEIGRTVGKSLAEFKRASEDFKRTWEFEVETEQRQQALAARDEQGPEERASEAAADAALLVAEAPAATTAAAEAIDGPRPAPLAVPRGPATFADETAVGPEPSGALAGPADHAGAAAEPSDEPATERVG